MYRPQLLALSGSLRRGSANTALLETIREKVVDRADVRLFPLDAVPPYNGDLDGEAPPAEVVALREAIFHADGLLVSSPEYNHGMSGVLKNALDWASRPLGMSSLTGKSVLTMTASPAATGGVRAHANLNELFISTASPIVLRPQIVVTSAHTKVENGRLTDDTTLTFIMAGVDDLLATLPAPPAVAEEQA